MQLINRRRTFLVAAAAAAVAACTTAALSGTVLAGASAAPKTKAAPPKLLMESPAFTGAQKLQSFTWGVETSTPGGSGSGVAKATPENLSVTFADSPLSPKFLDQVGSGLHDTTLSVILQKKGPSGLYAAETIELAEPGVVSIGIGGNGGGSASTAETVTFNYTAVQETFVPVNSNGTLGTPVVDQWNFEENNSTFP